MEKNCEITLNEYGVFTTYIDVPDCLMGRIIGRRGSTLRNIQLETHSSIKINEGRVKIYGGTKQVVESACHEIFRLLPGTDKFINTCNRKLGYFVSIPLISEYLKKNLETFRNDILGNPPKGVTENSFSSPHRLHLKICYTRISNEDKLTHARQILRKYYEEDVSKLFPKTKRYTLMVQGLKINVNEDPRQVSELYGKVFMEDKKEDENFQEIISKIDEYFRRVNLTFPERQEWQCILMSGYFQNKGNLKTFDASDILKKYGDFCFGTAEFNSIHLSIRGTGEESYYEAAEIIEI